MHLLQVRRAIPPPGNNQWRRKYLSALKFQEPPPAPAMTTAEASGDRTRPAKRTSLPSGALQFRPDASPHPRGDSPDEETQAVEPTINRAPLPVPSALNAIAAMTMRQKIAREGSADMVMLPHPSAIPVPMHADTLFDAHAGAAAARLRTRSAGDYAEGRERSAAVPIPVGGQQVPVGISNRYPRRMALVESGDGSSFGDESAGTSPVKSSRRHHGARMDEVVEEDEDVFGFSPARRTATLQQRQATSVAAHPAFPEDFPALSRHSQDTSVEGSLSSAGELGQGSLRKSYAAALLRSPHVMADDRSSEASISPLVAPLENLGITGGKGYSGTRRPRRELLPVGGQPEAGEHGANSAPTNSDSDDGTETGSKSKRVASEAVSTTTDGDGDTNYDGDEMFDDDDDDSGIGSSMFDAVATHVRPKRKAAALKTKLSKKEKSSESAAPMVRVRSGSAGSTGSGRSSVRVGGRNAHMPQPVDSPFAVSGRGHHAGRALTQAAAFGIQLPIALAPAAADSQDGDAEEEEDEGEEEGEEEDLVEEAADAIGSLPVVLPGRPGVAPADARGRHASFAVRGHSQAMAMPGSGLPVRHAAAATRGTKHPDKSAPGEGKPPADFPQMGLGASFVPPHLLAQQAAQNDVFSLGVRAQLKAKPRNI
jgi:hypothetical protein